MSARSAASLLRNVARETRSLPRKAIDEIVTTVSKAGTKHLAGDTGGDRILSGTTRRQATRLTVRKKVQGDSVVTGLVSPGPSGRPIAMWSWLEWGTVHTRPKHTWSLGVEPAVERAVDDVREMFSETIARL